VHSNVRVRQHPHPHLLPKLLPLQRMLT
jgi:hypothetical protein